MVAKPKYQVLKATDDRDQMINIKKHQANEPRSITVHQYMQEQEASQTQ